MKIINNLFRISSNLNDTNKQTKLRYKIMINLFIILIIISNCPLFGVSIFDKLLGITTTVKKENTNLENSIKKEFSDIRAELSLVKELQIKNDLRVSVMSNNSLKIEDVEGLINTKIVGYDKSMKSEIKTGRDYNIINDSKLLEFIFDKWAWIVGSIVSGFFSLIVSIFSLFKWQGLMYERLLDAKQKWIENLVKSNSEKDNKMDAWFMGKIDKQNGNK